MHNENVNDIKDDINSKIKEFERKKNIILPKEYINYLIEDKKNKKHFLYQPFFFNKGFYNYFLVSISFNEIICMFQFFRKKEALLNNKAKRIEIDYTNMLISDEAFFINEWSFKSDNDFLPIGKTGDALICLALKEENYGNIFLFHLTGFREYYDSHGEFQQDEIYEFILLADNFSDFIRNIVSGFMKNEVSYINSFSGLIPEKLKGSELLNYITNIAKEIYEEKIRLNNYKNFIDSRRKEKELINKENHTLSEITALKTTLKIKEDEIMQLKKEIQNLIKAPIYFENIIKSWFRKLKTLFAN